MTKKFLSSTVRLSDSEISAREDFRDFFLNNNPVWPEQILSNLGLFINRRTLSRILYMHELYQKILNVQGVVMEFGCCWGQNLALFENFRGIYEPYKVGRKIIGFDTFTGFPSVDEKDGKESFIVGGAYNLPENYKEKLEYILKYHESESPISHIQKHELVCGDASKTIGTYLQEHPETVIALAYFDIDLYKPTKDCLQAILPHMPKGSILAFDELNYYGFPGETIALQEVLGISNLKIECSNLYPSCSYIVL